MSLNKVMLIGRTGQDPELRYTNSGTAVANVSLATNKVWTDDNGKRQETGEWHRLVFWDRLAEITAEYAKKGKQIYVEGELQTRQWEDRDGNTKYTTEVKVYTMRLLGGRNEEQAPGQSSPSGSSTKEAADDFEPDDELPF